VGERGDRASDIFFVTDGQKRDYLSYTLLRGGATKNETWNLT